MWGGSKKKKKKDIYKQLYMENGEMWEKED